MYLSSRSYHFSAAHVLEGHPKCGRMHGHNYKVVVTLCAQKLNTASMVLDFGLMDDKLKPYFDQFDHRFLASAENFVGTWVAESLPVRDLILLSGRGVRADRSTCETLAELFYCEIHRIMLTEFQVGVMGVEVWESDKSSATFIHLLPDQNSHLPEYPG